MTFTSGTVSNLVFETRRWRYFDFFVLLLCRLIPIYKPILAKEIEDKGRRKSKET